MINALTIDVEDYYMVSAFADRICLDDWCNYESRVDRSTRIILDLLDEHGVQATFFVLGWVAERSPELVRDICQRGHEIASHGYNHRLVYNQAPSEFRDDLRRSKDILEDLTGAKVLGYRAASYSIVQQSLWALDILIEEGFLYDSSIFPIHHDRYGIPGAERFPHLIKRPAGNIIEFPPSTYNLMGYNVPVAGGGYLRLFPLSVTKNAIHRMNNHDKKFAIIYFHPWEIDVNQPKMNGRFLSNIRHYLNLRTTMPKLRTLMSEFRFQPLSLFLDHRTEHI